ncbi:restriction endonuclease subunit S [Flavobacterium cyclinae]|uniref:restriction endonuclease subunit S n=1 Tax=Flavobacterium cyclinae TaxID=2895947 RepID=UPI001E2BE445|nr:restriction endonuclease subunit S [Flavobacterium cyclinae]UGS19897.1 restriction endonuclease subunit S [Flavobacterium cyclinae]
MTIQNNIKSLKLDKSKWKLTKLGELADEISVRVDNPSKSKYDRFVGLEHFVSGDIKIKNWGTTENLVSSTKAFQKGDILFARRNAYLRRASLVEFEGCCSGDAFVIRENHNKVVPGFLAFLMNSNALWDFANSNAAGTMSKRVKWCDLAEYEFLLPPKDQQAQLAELLWSMDEVIEREKEMLKNLEINLDSSIENEIHGIEISGKTIKMIIEELSKKKKVVPLDSLGVFLKGKGIMKSDVIDSGIPCVRYGELYTKHHRIIRNYYSFVDRATANQSFRLERNDILLAGSGETITEIGKSASFVDDIEVYAGSDTLVFRPYEMDGYYLGYLMNSELVRKQLNKYGTGATVMHIYQSDIKKIKVPLINLENQLKISKKLEQFASNIEGLKSKISSSQSLQKSLINQVF